MRSPNPNPNPNPKSGGLLGFGGRTWHPFAVCERHLRAPASSGAPTRARDISRSRPGWGHPHACPRLRGVCTVAPPDIASAHVAAAGHGTPTKPLNGPRARHMRCRRGGPWCSGASRGSLRSGPSTRRRWGRKRTLPPAMPCAAATAAAARDWRKLARVSLPVVFGILSRA
jgi:hypothetical protein